MGVEGTSVRLVTDLRSYPYRPGDVVGFPSLASTSMEQGRIAACHAFSIETNLMPELFPYGIYTIPEISTVGLNEEELTKQGVPYEVGKAQYREIARGQIIGDRTGLLKLIFHLETHALLGVQTLPPDPALSYPASSGRTLPHHR